MQKLYSFKYRRAKERADFSKYVGITSTKSYMYMYYIHTYVDMITLGSISNNKNGVIFIHQLE